jgi:hypothetical protein
MGVSDVCFSLPRIPGRLRLSQAQSHSIVPRDSAAPPRNGTHAALAASARRIRGAPKLPTRCRPDRSGCVLAQKSCFALRAALRVLGRQSSSCLFLSLSFGDATSGNGRRGVSLSDLPDGRATCSRSRRSGMPFVVIPGSVHHPGLSVRSQGPEGHR